jgi:hypothetical protein
MLIDGPARGRVTALANSPLGAGLRSYWPLNEAVASGTRYDALGINDLPDRFSNVTHDAGVPSGKLGVAARSHAEFSGPNMVGNPELDAPWLA